jgi:hypothetical protein
MMAKIKANVKVKTVSEQAREMYRLLEDGKPLTAKEIAWQLHILPNAVYRVTDRLAGLGMVRKLDGYPMKFKAVPSRSALNWYLLAASQSFKQEFGDAASKQTSGAAPSMTFIKNRQHLLTMVELEARKATKTINYIVSGHRVPDGTVLAYRKASATGVRIRAIVQNTLDTTQNSLEAYQEMGVEVRYLPNIGIRLFTFDGRTAIMTSYDDTQSSRAFGIRFTYPPVALQLDQLFEQNWEQARAIT